MLPTSMEYWPLFPAIISSTSDLPNRKTRSATPSAPARLATPIGPGHFLPKGEFPAHGSPLQANRESHVPRLARRRCAPPGKKSRKPRFFPCHGAGLWIDTRLHAAEVVELVDTLGSGSSPRKGVGVRVSPSAPERFQRVIAPGTTGR